MPGFFTHYIAGKNVLKKTLPQIREKISASERLYNLGTLGPDIFFYYVPGQILKRSRGLAQQMHQNDLGIFIESMAREAKNSAQSDCTDFSDSPAAKRDLIFSYTAGFLMHYILDCHVHPYVYARSFNKSAPKIKNSANHRKFEIAIDSALTQIYLREENSTPRHSGLDPESPPFREENFCESAQWKLIAAEKNALNVSSEALSRALLETYERKIPAKTVRRAMKFTINAAKILHTEKISHAHDCFCEKNLHAHDYFCEKNLHARDCSNKKNSSRIFDCLNEKKSPWNTPWSPEIFYDSFMERYRRALAEATNTLESLYAYVYGDLQPKILAEKLGNRSLKTGQQCA
ncbi:MAG: zinc dependent phospholipase C family protein [Defluviitaleaceae bacterium]|nr:zinc dependent phospholipase C family protein [Defluviitaleaceae bacterium]